ncbi:MAG TPA: two-component system response regulator CreB [Thermoanaerobaculaceae bacterium]|nr:two-component system response regulator CreB [Thermoanaerobaculaceae bacterium]HPS76734.1 two-component system response regulator CreB [Thermoanaerobaculaceae bacterium]
MRPRVLIIEDERAVADGIVYALRTDGCEPLWVPTGGQGLALLSDSDIALVVLDVGLPDCNGFDLCRQIRRDHDVPIIFLTARSEEMDRVVGLEIGADDYVTKPFSPRELSARVRAVLRRARNHAPEGPAAPPAAVPFEVDEKRRAIAFFGHPLELTRTEHRLLEVLLGHPGWVYSREQLMELVWEDPGSAVDRTVDSHVKALRAKLRAIRPGSEAILTHRGQGYSLQERW